jgi:hypothetical protein
MVKFEVLNQYVSLAFVWFSLFHTAQGYVGTVVHRKEQS